MESPSAVGARAELEVASALARNGWAVFVPFFAPHSRVDLVFIDHRGAHTVQCKTSRLKPGVVSFRTCSNTANQPQSYRGEVEYFGVYSPELHRVFLVPVEGVGIRLCHLRLGPTRSGQQLGVRYAADYEVTPPR